MVRHGGSRVFGQTHITQRDRPHERIQKPGRATDEFIRAHALSAHIRAHDLGRVDWLHGGVRPSEDGAEDVDERDGGGRGGRAARFEVVGGGGGGQSEADDHAGRGAEEHFAAAEDVVEAAAGGGEDPAYEGVDYVEEEFGVGAGYADGGDEVGEVVRDYAGLG